MHSCNFSRSAVPQYQAKAEVAQLFDISQIYSDIIDCTLSNFPHNCKLNHKFNFPIYSQSLGIIFLFSCFKERLVFFKYNNKLLSYKVINKNYVKCTIQICK